MAKKKRKLPIDTGFNSKKEAAALGYIAASIERISDKEVLLLNSDLTTYSYTDKLIQNEEKYKYTYERLMEDHRAKGAFRVLSWVKNLNAEKFIKFLQDRNTN